MGKEDKMGGKVTGFVAGLAKVLPSSKEQFLESLALDSSQRQLLSGAVVKEIFVDVSQSLDRGRYREFLKKVLSHYIKTGRLRSITAVDSAVRGVWDPPENDAIGELLLVPFASYRDFTGLIMGNPEEIMVITDEDGFGDILRRMRNANVLVFDEAQNRYFRIKNRMVSQ